MADRYWVGGAGTWNAISTANWSTSSNGSSGASAPTAIDDVFIDTSSGTGTITCTSALATCNNITVTASQAITLAGTLSLINGNLSYPSGGSFSSTAALTFIAIATGKTITTNGKSVAAVTFNGVGGGWQLQDALTLGSARTLTLTSGTFDANNYNVTTGLFNSNNSNTRALKMGSGTWTITGTTGTIWLMSTSTGLTLTPSTSTISFTDTSANTKTFNGGALTYNNFSFVSNTTMNGGSTTPQVWNNFKFNGSSASTLTYTSGTTVQANTFTFQTQPTAILTITPSSTTNYTLTKIGGGIVDMQNVSISRCTASPSTGTWYAGASTDGGNNTGIRFVSAPRMMGAM